MQTNLIKIPVLGLHTYKRRLAAGASGSGRERESSKASSTQFKRLVLICLNLYECVLASEGCALALCTSAKSSL